MENVAATDIAIAGMSCRFPGARSVTEYRDMLVQGRSAFRQLSMSEVIAAGVPLHIAADPSYVRVAAPLEGIDEIDADTFHLPPSDITIIDPQHYHLLECTYEALVSASYTPLAKSRERVGVFVGADMSYYAAKRLSDDALWDPMGSWQELLGNDSHFLATSISHRLGLTGPSIGIQTACSTSLVAVHTAVQSLLAGDCDVAVAGGASIRGPQTRGYLFREGGILSPTGTCRPFDQDANGTLLSSGVGVVVMMRLSDALDKSIPIWAVLKGSAVNNDGNRKVGFTAPSFEGQAAVIDEAVSVAKVAPATIGYVEAHGTGTKLGDPIEVRALAAIYQPIHQNGQFGRIGSVKSNFGHLESAAGVAGLIKAVLSVQYNEIYPTLGFSAPNSEIDFQNSFFKVADRMERYPNIRGPRRASTSSFGIGGTNCHVVIEEPPSSKNAISPELRTFPFQRKRVWMPPSAPVTQSPEVSKVEPETLDIRAVLADLWRDILGEYPEPLDDFLAVGGDSLKAARLAAKIKDTLNVEISVIDILESANFSVLVEDVDAISAGVAVLDYPLSVSQQSLWHWQLISPSSPAYTVQAVFRLKGRVDIEALQQAFSDLVIRQDALRGMIYEKNGRLRQRIVSDCDKVPWRYIEITGDQSATTKFILEHGQTIIDLSKPPLLDALLISTGEKTHLLSVISHHLVSDEWSAQIMLGDVLEFYTARVEKRRPALKKLRTSMAIMAAHEAQWINTGAAEMRLEYWRNKLAGAARFDLPGDRPRREVRTHTGAMLPFQISESTYGKIKALAHEHKATPFMLLATIFKVLWLRYSSQSDLCIGTNIAGRENDEESDVVGMFTRTVALRTDLSGNPTFEEALRRVRQTALDAYENQLPFPMVIDTVQPQRVVSRNPLFDVMFVLQNVPQRMKAVSGLEVEAVPFHNGTSKFDMELTLEESGGGSLVGRWEYDTDIFDEKTVEQLSRHYLQLLDSALERPKEPVSRLKMISSEERTILLERWNQNEPDFGDDTRGVWERFVEQAGLHGEATAVITPRESSITYDELLRRSRALAVSLHEFSVKPEELVGIFCERSEWYVQALLGVQACGAAFLPLDLSLPDSRLADIVRDSRVQYVITQRSCIERLSSVVEPLVGRSIHKIAMDGLGDAPGLSDVMTSKSELAYVMYTSGTTGRPKGAMVSHKGMLNHLDAKIQTLGLGRSTKLAQTASVCFDISIWQCLAPLIVGGTVVIISNEQVRNVAALLNRLENEQVNIVELVPSYMDVVLGHLECSARSFPALKYLISTGESLSVETCRRLFESFPGVSVVNAYGPTECSDDVLQYIVRECPGLGDKFVPIGFALPNAKVYLLDDNLEPVPIGAVGEIYIGGKCVGIGYLNDAQRTSESFLPDSFAKQPHSTLYKTGDMARRRADGSIEYLWRIDSQVKIRGTRVEVEEVEAVLRSCPGADEIAVTLDESGETLLAFISNTSDNRDIDLSALRNHAETKLPDYMRPSRYVKVNIIPRSPTGKVDRIALRSMILCDETILAPSSAGGGMRAGAFELIHSAFCRVLNRAVISDNADFFENGGDSLKAMRVVALLQRDGIALSPADIYAHSTLNDLSRYCDGRTGFCISGDKSINRQQLTYGEEWFLAQDLPDARLCDSAFLLDLGSTTSAHDVEEAVGAIWEKHEGLRTLFTNMGGTGWSRTTLPPKVPAPFSIVNLSGCTLEELKRFVATERNRTTGNDGPLFRATLIICNDELHLLIVAHYLVCDFVSWRILLDDLIELLSNERIKSGLRLPDLHDLNRNHAFNEDSQFVSLTVEETDSLILFARQRGLPVEAVLATALTQALLCDGNDRKLTLAIGRHGRNMAETNIKIPGEVGRYAYPSSFEVELQAGEEFTQIMERIRNTIECLPEPTIAQHLTSKESFIVGLDYLGETGLGDADGDIIRSISQVSRKSLPKSARLFDLELLAEVNRGLLTLEFRAADANLLIGLAEAVMENIRVIESGSDMANER